MGDGGGGLGLHHRIRLAVVGAALGMARMT